MISRERIETVVVVVPTPLRDDRVDLDGFRRNLGYLVSAGIQTLCVGGNTGEYAALAASEMRELQSAARDAAGEAAVIVGVGGTVANAVESATEALVAGADAIMIHQPPGPHASSVGTGKYFATIARAVDAPIVLYPRGPTFDDRTLVEVRDLPNLLAIKYAYADPIRFGKLVAQEPQLTWICGLAESWAIPFWALGARGFTSGLASVHPKRSLDLLEALRQERLAEARAIWLELLPFEELRARHGDANNVGVIKTALDALGLAGGSVRPPSQDLSEDDRLEVRQILALWGLLEPAMSTVA